MQRRSYDLAKGKQSSKRYILLQKLLKTAHLRAILIVSRRWQFRGGIEESNRVPRLYYLSYAGSAKVFSIEDGRAVEAIKGSAEIVFAYPVYFSNMPKIVCDFIHKNHDIFFGKKVFVIATMGLFSGDGAGCSSRLLAKYGAHITGGLHLKMPDCIGDEKALKRTKEQNYLLVIKAVKKIKDAAENLKLGKSARQGLGFWYHLSGLFGQRLWFYHKTKRYSDKLHIEREKCIGCGICVSACPMDNISLQSGKAQQKGTCTMCYRCVNHCPKQAITLLGKKLYEQCTIEKYL